MGVFKFLAGLGSLAASCGMALSEDARIEQENAEYRAGNYSMYTQVDYDSTKYRFIAYDLDKIGRELRKGQYMSDSLSLKLAMTAIAKQLMERETSYNYYVPKEFRHIDFDRIDIEDYRNELL